MNPLPIPAAETRSVTGTGVRGVLARDSWAALVLSTVAGAALVLGAGLTAWSLLPTLLGWESAVVMSGSMSPSLMPGDVAVARPIDPARSLPGQVLLVDDPDHPGSLRLHRLLAVEESGLRLQGDANAAADTSLVSPAAVHGVGVLRIPAVGLPVVWAHEESWAPLAGTGGVLAVLLAAASWSRPGAAPAAAGPLPSPRAGGGGHRYGRRDRPAPPRHRPSARHTAPLRRTRSVVTLLAATPILVLGMAQSVEPAGAAYAASTANITNTFGLTRVSDWGCIDETSAPAARFYAFRETTGTTAYNTGTRGAAGNGTYRGGVTLDTPGPDCGFGPTRAVTLDGSSGRVTTAGAEVHPSSFTVQVWFRTSTAGGKLFGFRQGELDGGQYDRHVYLTDTGTLLFGIYNGGFHTVRSTSSYADGAWHLVTASLGGGTMALYVDGLQVAVRAGVPGGEPYTGFWRFGGDTIDGSWPSQPASDYVAGSLAHGAVWDTVLTPSQVQAQYRPAR